MFQIRTDLAMEISEQLLDKDKEMKGISMQKIVLSEDMTKTIVRVETENGARQMNKPKGTYITIEAANMMEEDGECHREIAQELSKVLRELLPLDKKFLKILVAGLGNRMTTPDALGPLAVDHLFVTRHLIQEFGTFLVEFEKSCSVSAIVPGVMAQTGMESVEIIKGIVDETRPDYLIVVDALAARSIKRLSRTIQISDTGIVPGSGVGNHRNAIDKKYLGIPVICIGVPTVVDAATIVADSFTTMMDALDVMKDKARLKEELQQLNEAEQEELIRELLSPKMNAMYVTNKDIDEEIERLSFIISEGLNMTFLPKA